jgi:hypothetical protein
MSDSGYAEYYDTNNDGVADTVLIDTDGDHHTDIEGIDTDGDHQVDVILVDRNHDGVADLEIDRIDDNTAVAYADNNFDGQVDHAAAVHIFPDGSVGAVTGSAPDDSHNPFPHQGTETVAAHAHEDNRPAAQA